jgi:uncharacterized protein YqeY
MNERLKKDQETFMKAQDKFSLTVIRMLKSAIELEKISKKEELTDDEIIAVIKKQVKIKKDSILEYTKYNKMDTVKELEKEIEVLSVYLPEEMSLDKLTEVIDSVITEVKPTSMKEMGIIMKKVSEIVGNQADMGKVSAIVKEKLS